MLIWVNTLISAIFKNENGYLSLKILKLLLF